ncbi:MAG: hypothetical protein QM757_41150 [Paludibaculum sp.]
MGVVISGAFRGATTLGEVKLDASKGKALLARLDGQGSGRWARETPVTTCLVVSSSGQVLVTTEREVLRVSAAGDLQRVFRAEAASVTRLGRCALSGADWLFASGVAPVGASVGGKPIGKPLTQRLPAWVSTYEVSFAARLDL